jgi:hypothetical protein
MKFRKKPVVIDAVTWYGKYSGGTGWPDWFRDAMDNGGIGLGPGNGCGSFKLHIHTLEGMMTADSGDKIIRGVKGEIYPCKPDIFEATYERAE